MVYGLVVGSHRGGYLHLIKHFLQCLQIPHTSKGQGSMKVVERIEACFVGLFIGAVVLAVGYKVFMQWVSMYANGEDEEAEPETVPAGE